MRYAFIVSSLILATTAVADEPLKAEFLNGTYVMSADDCTKLQKLEAGAEPSLNEMPWSVDRDGFHSWEGNCTFSKITETKPGAAWRVEAECTDAADESTEAYTFEKKDDGTFLVQLEGEGEPVTYQRCDTRKGQ